MMAGTTSWPAHASFLTSSIASKRCRPPISREVFQQIIYSYDVSGKAGKPKVINYNTKTPTFKPATMDFTKVMPPPGQEQATPVQGGQPMAQPVPGFQQGNAVQQGAPIYAPGAEPPKQEEPKKKSFWKKLFNKD